jgi:hypothetical protein
MNFGDTDASEILQRLNSLRSSCLAQIEDDYSFSVFYPLNSKSEAHPLVMLISERDELRRSAIQLITLRELPEYLGLRVLTPPPREPVGGIPVLEGFTEEETARIQAIHVADSEILNHVTVLEGLMDDKAAPGLLDRMSGIYIVVSADTPDLSRSVRSFLSKTRHHHLMKLVVLGDCQNALSLSQLMWTLSKHMDVVELPTLFLMDTNDGKSSFKNDLLEIPKRLALLQLSSTVREAELARAHALLMSHIKAQLPTFNRASKQEKLSDDLGEVIKTVSSKSGIPISQFPSADFIRDKIRQFDFTKLKRMKESNLHALNEFLEKEAPKFMTYFPSELRASSHIYSGSSEPTLSIDMCEFADVFRSLEPDSDGIVRGGEKLRNHLLSVSKLSSQSLYRIWQLSDTDRDGGLNLREYTICRALIRMVMNGQPLPRTLPRGI